MLLPQAEKGRGIFRKAHRDGILWRARLLNHHKDGDREFCRAWSNLLQWEVSLPMEVNELQAPFQPKSFHGSAPYKQTSALLGITPTRMLILQDQTAPDAETSQQGSTSWGNPAPIQLGKHSQQSGKAEGNERRHLSSSVSHLPAHHFPSHPAPAVPPSIRMSQHGM